jgi:predicted nucleotidyltransferase component of viral defense system
LVQQFLFLSIAVASAEENRAEVSSGTIQVLSNHGQDFRVLLREVFDEHDRDLKEAIEEWKDRGLERGRFQERAKTETQSAYHNELPSARKQMREQPMARKAS